jgi:hypothetical protein
MSDDSTAALVKYLDAEFAKLSSRAHPKVVFRGKDVIAGDIATLHDVKFASSRYHSDRVSVGKALNSIVTDDGGCVGGYRIIPISGNRARGTQYMATRIKDGPA